MYQTSCRLLLIAATLVQAGAAETSRAATARNASQTISAGSATVAEPAEASRTIDRLVADQLARAVVKPNPRTSDEQFLRRIYLDAIGRIPTADEARAFLDARGSDKRSALIQKLVASDGWVSHNFNFFADLLRVETRLMNRYPGQAYIDWVKQSLRDNKPYDQFVSELIRAEGHALDRGHGATGYYVRDIGMPLDNMANTVQVFLGTRVTCAQCHDHPTDVWKRHDFFEMAAYTAGTQVKRDLAKPGEGGMRRPAGMAGLAAQPQEVRNAFRMLSSTLGLRVEGNTKSTIPLPADYQYTDHKPGEPVSAHALFGDPATVKTRQDPREVYAAWMTSPENPRFTQVIASRMWKKVMGIGLVDQVDNLTNETRPTNPELYAYLTKLMIAVKYDLRRFQRILFETETYQRAASHAEAAAGEPYHFPGPVLRRMTAEQLWDSLLTLAVNGLDELKGDSAEHLYEFYQKNKDKTATELLAMATEMGSTRKKLGELQQRFTELRQQMATASPEERVALRKKLQELGEERQALSNGPMGDLMKYKGQGPKGRGGQNLPLLRASELPAPAPQGHFLRTFGQSDREVIDNATLDPAVTQALTLLNGPINADLHAATSPLQQAVTRAREPRDKVRAIFLSILCREPTDAEWTMLQAHAKQAGPETTNDLIWALVNSAEFKFVQ